MSSSCNAQLAAIVIATLLAWSSDELGRRWKHILIDSIGVFMPMFAVFGEGQTSQNSEKPSE